MAVYIKNATGVNQIWVGQTITPGAYHLFDNQNIFIWGFDEDLIAAIDVGDAIVATSDDGLEDVATPKEAQLVFRSQFPLYQSFTFSRDKTVRDDYLRITGKTTSNDVGYIIGNVSNINSVTFANTLPLTDTDLEIRKNDVVIHTWEIRDAKEALKSLEFGDAEFDIGDILSVFLKGAGTLDPDTVVVIVTLGFLDLRRIETIIGS